MLTPKRLGSFLRFFYQNTRRFGCALCSMPNYSSFQYYLPGWFNTRTMAGGRCYWPRGVIRVPPVGRGGGITAGFPLRSMHFVRGCAQRPLLAFSLVFLLAFERERVKAVVYKVVVLTVLLYGCEVWGLTKRLWQKLRSFHMDCVRTIGGIHMWHVQEYHISNSTILERTELRNIEVYVHRSVGHRWCLRQPSNKISLMQ